MKLHDINETNGRHDLMELNAIRCSSMKLMKIDETEWRWHECNNWDRMALNTNNGTNDTGKTEQIRDSYMRLNETSRTE